jgi:AraC-like DNA-binding protein
MFYLAGVSLAFFLTLLLVSKSKKTVADKILAGWLFFLTLHLLLYYFIKAQLYPQLLAVGFPLPLVHGPFLYLYTIALTQERFSWKSMLHFIPTAAILVYLIPFFQLPVEQKIYIFENRGIGYETFNLVRTIAYSASGVVYIILTATALRNHRAVILHQFSSTEKINLQWLQYLLYGLATIWAFVLLGLDDVIYVVAVFFVLFIGFFGIRQVGIFHSQQPPVAESNPDSQPNTHETETHETKKYQKSGLSADTSETLHRDLTQLMTAEKYFRESELSLADLAKRLNTQPNYLSQVINEREGKNFYDYINTLRVEEFIRRAGSPDSRKYTLLGLAQECGFNSKSSFNRYFKKVTGKSPSQFNNESI